MNPARTRQQAMPHRLLAVMLVAVGASAWAQTDEPTPPPMVPVDQAPLAPDPGLQPAPYPTNQQPQNQQPQNQQPQYQQPQYQQPQYQQPQNQQPQDQQPQYQQPQYQQPQYQQPQYQQPQYQQPQYQQPQYQQPPQQPVPQRAPPPEASTTGVMSSSRTKHFVGLLSGSLGVTNDTAGIVGNARVEVDITRIGLLLSYSNFISEFAGFGGTLQVHQFNIMGGWAFFSSDQLTLRVLGGLDVMLRDGTTAFGPVVGTNVRSMWDRIGVDAAFMVTFFPFRQLELRATFVFRWSIFEAHLGWRVQVIDATQSGTLATLFTNSPGVNGPVAGVGLTF